MFVRIVLLCLYISTILSTFYYSRVLVNPSTYLAETGLDNAIQTLSDFFYFMFEWCFFYQYLSTSLLLPIVMDHQTSMDDVGYERRVKQAKKIMIIITSIFFSFLSVWFILSIVTSYRSKEHLGVVRSMITLPFSAMTLLFVWSLQRIKTQIKRLESGSRNKLLRNRCLLNAYLVTKISELLFDVGFILLEMIYADVIDDVATPKYCEAQF